MAATYSVLADSEGEAEKGLREMCDRMGLEPVGRPQDLLRDGKWLGRARPPAPPED